MRNRFTVVCLAAFLALAAVACSSRATSSAGNNGALDPQGGPTTTAPSVAGGGPSLAASAPAGLRSFAFPANVRVEFHSPLPASGPRRAAMIGYENYIDSVWYAVYTRGSSTAYKQYVGGNALTFARSLVREFSSDGYRLRGTIVYYDISVPQVFYRAGAVVQSCVDASRLYRVKAKTGHIVGTIFSASYDHYQEQASAGKAAAGFWTVSHTENLPAANGGSAGVCI
jgi:hypothetical protein